VFAVSDRGSGIDGSSIVVRIDGDDRTAHLRGGRLEIPTNGLAPGRHELRLQLSDYQETRNMENVGQILPNTRIVTTAFTVAG
jgi:hypothetical protein